MGYRLTREDRRPWASDWSNWLTGLPSGYATPLSALLAKFGLTSGGSKDAYAYTLDAVDNLTQVTAPDESWSATVNANNQYQSAKGSAWQYDAAGNLIDDGKRTYTWDAAHRLIQVSDKSTGQKSEFAYDGQSRLTIRKEYATATATPSEMRYLWCGERICQSRDTSDTVTGRYYPQGELQGATALYYVKDHLGSVTDIVTAQGKSQGKLDYGPYGEQEKATGKLSDFRYAGMLIHAPTGFYFTHYRVYDPETGRWLSRDPIAEAGGINLYTYVGNNPVNRIDPDGRFFFVAAFGWGAFTAAADMAVAGATSWLISQQAKTPNTGDPDSVHVNPGSGQERKYGPDGKPEYDIDWDHDHGQGVPHGHNWDGDDRDAGVPVSPWPRGRKPQCK